MQGIANSGNKFLIEAVLYAIRNVQVDYCILVFVIVPGLEKRQYRVLQVRCQFPNQPNYSIVVSAYQTALHLHLATDKQCAKLLYTFKCH